MEDDFSFMDMSQFTHPGQLTNVSPSIIQHQQHVMVTHSFVLTLSPRVSTRIRPYHRSLPYRPTGSGSAKLSGRNTPTKKWNGSAAWKKLGCPGGIFPWLLSLDDLNSKIAEHFPGRSRKSLQVSYCVNFKKRTEKFQDGDVIYLKGSLITECCRGSFFKRLFGKKSMRCGKESATEWVKA